MILLFDGQCPLCSAYSRYAGSRLEGLDLTDARWNPELGADLKGRGYDVNDGMLLITEGGVLQGREAVAALAGMTEPNGHLDRAVRRLTLVPVFLGIVYPGMKLVRQIALKLLGRDNRISV